MYIAPITKGETITLNSVSYLDQNGNTIASPDYTLTLSFRNNGNVLDVVSNSQGQFVISSTQTNTLNVGNAFFQITATKNSNVFVVDRGQVQVLADLRSEGSTYDARSQTRIDLDNVQSLIRQLIQTGGTAEYKIGNRSARKYDLAELRAEESKLLYRLAREERSEKIKSGLGDPFTKYVRF